MGRSVPYTRAGEAGLLTGRMDDARQYAQIAHDRAAENGERGTQAWALRLLGEIAARREPLDAGQAEAHFRDALALAEQSGMRPLQARCHLGLGKLHRRCGRPGEARAELTTAVTMLREMEMTHWLPQVEAELAQVHPAASDVGTSSQHAG